MISFSLFSQDSHLLSVPAGSFLFREGEDGNKMFVLVSGKAEIVVGNRVVEVMAEGSVVGEMGVISPEPRSASVLASTDCTFAEVDEKRFLFLVQQTPYFALQVMKLLAERLRNTNRLVPEIEDV